MVSRQSFSPTEVKEILRKEEELRRKSAKKRQEEILRLIEEQKWDLAGKLWGEKSFDELKAKKYPGGNGKEPNYTDVEAEVCADVRDYGVDPDTLAQPEENLLVREAWEIACKSIIPKWNKSGLELFFLWLGMPIVELCRENKLPAISTLELTKEMVLACRLEVGSSDEFPFELEEKEIHEIARKLSVESALKRRVIGESAPADLESRVWLKDVLPGYENMPLDAVFEALKKQGHKLCRATAHRAKISGWFSRPGWKREVGRKIKLTAEERQAPLCYLAEKFGISSATAKRSRERGFFLITRDNREKVKILDLTDENVRKKIRAELAFHDASKRLEGEEIITHCALCAGELKLSEATIDHVIPRSEGGHDLMENLCLAHADCNMEKGSRVSPFRELADLLPKNEEFVVLPEKIFEVAGRKISDLSINEIHDYLGYSISGSMGARAVQRRGFIATKNLYREKRGDLAARIAKLEKEGWPPS